MAIYVGASPVTAVYRGAIPVERIYRGDTLIWSTSGVYDSFNGTGALTGWINELDAGTTPGWGGLSTSLFSDGILGLINGLGQLVGSIVAFIPGGGPAGIGSLFSSTPGLNLASLASGGGSGLIDRLLGLLNGIPILGDLIPDDVPLDITSIIGQIPVVGQLVGMLGLAGNEAGEVGDPTNFITDDDGLVLGLLSGSLLSKFFSGGEDHDVKYVIGEMDGAARMLIPDGLVGLNKQTSRFRHQTQVSGDDGYLQIRVANAGSANHVTQVFRRGSNNGSYSNGVGIDLRNSSISIVRRAGGTDNLVAPNLGALTAGNVIRLKQTGNLHTLYRNGTKLGEWNDSTATAAKGGSYRSILMKMEGGKELLGPRRFSPSLDYVDAG